MGCCDGLVCILNVDGNLAIWNPLIKRYRKLPSERVEYSRSTNGPLFAFGRDPHNDDYKVLRVVDLNVKVYSLKSHSWKRVEQERPIDKASICSKPTYFNGALHFIVKTPDFATNLPRGMLHMQLIVSFDLATEKFHVFKTPSQGAWRKHLEVWEDIFVLFRWILMVR